MMIQIAWIYGIHNIVYFSDEQILNIMIKPRLGMRLGSAPGYGQAWGTALASPLTIL
jgi:hypothetical protein